MPSLTVLAGPNGVGKTRSTNYLLDNGFLPVKPLDFDLLRNEAIDVSVYDSYLTPQKISKTVHNLIFAYCSEAIKKGEDFSFECNFRNDQLRPIVPFDKAGYDINLVFMLLYSVEQSIARVNSRKKEGGNLVDSDSIKINFESGLKNLDDGFPDFQNIIIIDNSVDNENGIIVFAKHKKMIEVGPNFPPKSLLPYLPKLSDFCREVKSQL